MWFCADNVRGLKPRTEAMDRSDGVTHAFVVEERCKGGEAGAQAPVDRLQVRMQA